MTRNKARKKLVRERSAKTGESYTAALRQLLANKETPMGTTTTSVDETTDRQCTMCGRTPIDPNRLLSAGGAPICADCDERVRSVFRNHLAPVALAANAPLDQFMSTIAYEREDDHWVVHLHTFRPGPVIGSGGATAQELRDGLVDLTGDEKLRLNLVEHQARGCRSKSELP